MPVEFRHLGLLLHVPHSYRRLVAALQASKCTHWNNLIFQWKSQGAALTVMGQHPCVGVCHPLWVSVTTDTAVWVSVTAVWVSATAVWGFVTAVWVLGAALAVMGQHPCVGVCHRCVGVCHHCVDVCHRCVSICHRCVGVCHPYVDAGGSTGSQGPALPRGCLEQHW